MNKGTIRYTDGSGAIVTRTLQGTHRVEKMTDGMFTYLVARDLVPDAAPGEAKSFIREQVIVQSVNVADIVLTTVPETP